MTDWLTSLQPHWFWIALGLILGAAEMLAPGFFLIWLAVAALIVGALAFLLPTVSIPFQVAVFAILSILAVYAGKRYLARNPIQTSDPLLNDRGARMVGEIVTVTDAIADGRGRVQVGDTQWLARGTDAAKGTRVRVMGADGAVLLVEPV